MPGNLLNVSLGKMSQTADCLAACAAMVLDYIIQYIHETIPRLLGRMYPYRLSGYESGNNEGSPVMVTKMRRISVEGEVRR